MKCFNCKNDLTGSSKFCPFCGADLTRERFCTNCGTEKREGMKFCPECGEQFCIQIEKDQGEAVSTQGTAEVVDEAELNVVAGAETLKVEKPKGTAMKKRKLWWLLIPAVVCVLGIVVVVLTTGSKTVAAAAENVLYLEAYDSTGMCISGGSGFLIDDGVTLVTNYHVIEDAYALVAMTADGEHSVEVDIVLTYDKTADLAILKCKEAIGASPLVLANSDLVKQGDTIYAAGYPLGLAHTLSDGIVGSKYSVGNVDILQITAPISSGSSGGALLNEQGEVVGVVRAYYPDAQNMNLAIASNEITELLGRNVEPRSLEGFYRNIHPQVELDDYLACVRMALLPSEDVANQIYDEWINKGSTEAALVVLLDEYAPEQGGGVLRFIKLGEQHVEVERWCFDRERRVGDIAMIESEDGYYLCYFSDVIKDGDYIAEGSTVAYFLKRAVAGWYEDGYITREEYEQDMKQLLSADTSEEYHNSFEHYWLQHKVDVAKGTQ